VSSPFLRIAQSQAELKTLTASPGFEQHRKWSHLV